MTQKPTMKTNAIDRKAQERFQQLLKKRTEILEMPPEAAMERILDDPHPAALVHSFPEQDFYFLINGFIQFYLFYLYETK